MRLLAIITFGILILNSGADSFNTTTRITPLNETTILVRAGENVRLGWQYRLNTDEHETFRFFYCGYHEKGASDVANGIVPLAHKQIGKDFLPAFLHQPDEIALPKASKSGFAARVTAYQNPNTGACYMDIKRADQTMNDLKISCILLYRISNHPKTHFYMGPPLHIKVDSSKLTLGNAFSGLKHKRIRTIVVVMSGGLSVAFLMAFLIMGVTLVKKRTNYALLKNYEHDILTDGDVETDAATSNNKKNEKTIPLKKSVAFKEDNSETGTRLNEEERKIPLALPQTVQDTSRENRTTFGRGQKTSATALLPPTPPCLSPSASSQPPTAPPLSSANSQPATAPLPPLSQPSALPQPPLQTGMSNGKPSNISAKSPSENLNVTPPQLPASTSKPPPKPARARPSPEKHLPGPQPSKTRQKPNKKQK